ncbi:ribosome maturation factor RimM [Methylococcus sp. EFPC2]|uniref:ribosome maturation factor RimM n=1 Tax=Methylococcus sp. EFPC2 TaxID=2812648 RepID=UPI0019675DD6|nr:ribosome maturation factor RimM [Methylococcus sp. EFPC2]QSA97149.1 ribosome maturation factor RimM [Methylococcus sp. EFPC2]
MSRLVVVGEIAGAHGVKGWVKIHSFTEPRDAILDYVPWVLDTNGVTRECKVLAARAEGPSVLARLEQIEDRDQAAKLRFSKILAPRDRFPVPEPGHYYWADLIGLQVKTVDGQALGIVTDMMATGANDVMVVKGERERLVPFVTGEYVKEVHIDEGYLIVDWDPEF